MLSINYKDNIFPFEAMCRMAKITGSVLSGCLTFENASNLEEKVRMVIERAGYEPETELDYGVNWAYMQNRMESIDPFSFVLIAGALAVILLTGYLIIYNILALSEI